MSEQANRTVLITGESSVIGEAFAAVCPGLIRTEFHIAAGIDEMTNAPNWLWMDSRTLAKQGLDAVMNGKMILINGRLNKIFAVLAKIIPKYISRSIARTLTKRTY